MPPGTGEHAKGALVLRTDRYRPTIGSVVKQLTAYFVLTISIDAGSRADESRDQPGPTTDAEWRVIAYDSGRRRLVNVLSGSDISARLGRDGRVTGSAGCNHYFAGYETAGVSISITVTGLSRRSCREPEGVTEQGRDFLQALASVQNDRLKEHRLLLEKADTTPVVKLILADGLWAKIHFDPDLLNTLGLMGPADGLRALHYEYCIPDDPEKIRQVKVIDPTLQIQPGSPGRTGCRANQLLCLGHTYQTDYRTVLEQLAALTFITEIRQAFFE